MTTSILLVDDEPLILSSLQRVLRREGFKVFVAAGTIEAIDIVMSERIDIVLADYGMPDPNGLELLKRLRDQHPEVACVVATAALDVDRRIEKAVVAAGGLLLMKPWDLDDFKVVVEAALARRARRAEALAP